MIVGKDMSAARIVAFSNLLRRIPEGRVILMQDIGPSDGTAAYGTMGRLAQAKRMGLVSQIGRGGLARYRAYKITEKGLQFLKDHPVE